jgi:serine/threonine protein kinase
MKPLSKGTIIKSKHFTYTIEKEISKDSFVRSYLADMLLQIEGPLGKIRTKSTVTIQEFFIDVPTYDRRLSADEIIFWYQYFTQRARNISKLNTDNTVKVIEIFEANSSAYVVCEYVEDISLQQYIKEHGRLSEQEALDCIDQVATILEQAHNKGIAHRQLNPECIYRKPDGNVKLNYMTFDNECYVLYASTDCDSPLPSFPYWMFWGGEERMHDCSPCSDTYSLGAILYFLLTGQTPPRVSYLIEKGLPFPAYVSTRMQYAIKQMMRFEAEERPQSIAECRQLLFSSTPLP